MLPGSFLPCVLVCVEWERVWAWARALIQCPPTEPESAPQPGHPCSQENSPGDRVDPLQGARLIACGVPAGSPAAGAGAGAACTSHRAREPASASQRKQGPLIPEPSLLWSTSHPQNTIEETLLDLPAEDISHSAATSLSGKSTLEPSYHVSTLTFCHTVSKPKLACVRRSYGEAQKLLRRDAQPAPRCSSCRYHYL